MSAIDSSLFGAAVAEFAAAVVEEIFCVAENYHVVYQRVYQRIASQSTEPSSPL